MADECLPLLAAVDLGGTWLRVGVARQDGRLRRRRRERTRAQEGPKAVIAQIERLVAQAVAAESRGRPPGLVLAVGVPGPLEPGGVVVGSPNLPGWDRVRLRDLLARSFGCECLVEHDANLGALAEHRRGRGRGSSDFAYITVSTGIGAGLILRGQLYRGHRGSAGEFGHMVVEPDGPSCNCGNRGCLEAVASGTAIARDAGAPSAAAASRRAAAGDPRAQQVLRRAARHLGLALGGLINLLNPEVVAVGGGVVAASPQFWESIVEAVPEASFPSSRASCSLVQAALDEDQGLLGAIELGLDFIRDQNRSRGRVAS